MAERSAPILLSLTPTTGGQLEAVWSVVPGRRVRMLVEWASATPDGLAEIAATILPMIDRDPGQPRIQLPTAKGCAHV